MQVQLDGQQLSFTLKRGIPVEWWYVYRIDRCGAKYQPTRTDHLIRSSRSSSSSISHQWSERGWRHGLRFAWTRWLWYRSNERTISRSGQDTTTGESWPVAFREETDIQLNDVRRLQKELAVKDRGRLSIVPNSDRSSILSLPALIFAPVAYLLRLISWLGDLPILGTTGSLLSTCSSTSKSAISIKEFEDPANGQSSSSAYVLDKF